MKPYLPFFAAFCFLLPSAAQAQNLLYNYQNICPGNWESQACLSTISQIVYKMVEKYEKGLDNISRSQYTPALREHCAAAVAAAYDEYPAYAMKSAYTACANGLFEMSEHIALKPQPEAYQLLVSAILCLSGDARCPEIEKQLISMR